MMFNSLHFLHALLAVLVLQIPLTCAKTLQKSTSTFSVESCITKQTTSSVTKVKSITRYKTLHFHPEVTSTYTPSTTSTPSPSTIVVTKTSVTTSTDTVSQLTDTVTVTSTSTSSTTTSSTLTDTIVTTTIATTIVPVTTTIVPTVSGFLPIESDPTVEAGDGSEYYSSGERKRRGVVDDTSIAKARPYAARNIAALHNPDMVAATVYPFEIVCDVAVEIITITTKVLTAKSTATITATASTSTSYTNTVSTSTTYATPAHATVTSTVSTTITSTTTLSFSTITTSTVSTTSTAYGPAVTSYAACSSNNFLADIYDSALINIYYDNNVLTASTSDALGCCELCQTTPDCSGSAYFRGGCLMFTDNGTCDATATSWYYQYHEVMQPGYNVSNGNCGRGFDLGAG